MSGMSGVAAYQQTNNVWNQQNKKTEDTTKAQGAKNETTSKTDKDIQKSTWKPIDTSSSLVPSHKDGIGMAIGDVQLSDKAKDYYAKLKSKFGNMEFIAVSQDMKSQVQANAAAYGNANKQVVLIDDAKLEQMANDESFRKKYEGIVAMSQAQLANAKNSLASSGASIKNFGMSVNSDGSTNFFATLEKSNNDQAKRLEKKQTEKKAAKAKEKKLADKKAKEERLEKSREEQKVKREKLEKVSDSDDKSVKEADDKEYIEIKANTMEDLISQVSKYAYDNSAKSIMTDAEKSVGQQIDFRGKSLKGVSWIMKIGEAQSTYSQQIRAYNTARNELYAKKEELNNRINSTPNGAVVYQNEAAVLELQYDAVDKKRQEYQDYMDKLLEQKTAVWNMKVADQQADVMADAAKEQGKVMEVARRIMKGDKVPAGDEKKLMEYDWKLYSMAKNAAAMLELQKKRKEHKSLWDDDEGPKETPDIEGETDDTEAFADGPEVVDVDTTLSNATADMGSSEMASE